MNPFRYTAATDVAGALRSRLPGGRFIAGGTNLVDLMRERVARPSALVDINPLPLAAIEPVGDGGLLLGALARNADTAEHALVKTRYPMLRAALLAGASPQIRNRATNGGNLLQRTRCVYFYDVGVPCNKRDPGTGCPAVTGLARQHAILGASEDCIATHPSDFCVALLALDATVHVRSPQGARAIAMADFHRLPGDRPDLDTTLADDELITHITLPPATAFAAHSTYLKIRERASYAFALVSVAAGLELGDDGRVRAARLALGGVAHKPWRDPRAEDRLVGRPPDASSFGDVADAVLAPARAWGGPALPNGLPGNSFKIPLARRAIVRAFEMARDGIPTNTGEDAARSSEPST